MKEITELTDTLFFALISLQEFSIKPKRDGKLISVEASGQGLDNTIEIILSISTYNFPYKAKKKYRRDVTLKTGRSQLKTKYSETHLSSSKNKSPLRGLWDWD